MFRHFFSRRFSSAPNQNLTSPISSAAPAFPPTLSDLNASVSSVTQHLADQQQPQAYIASPNNDPLASTPASSTAQLSHSSDSQSFPIPSISNVSASTITTSVSVSSATALSADANNVISTQSNSNDTSTATTTGMSLSIHSSSLLPSTALRPSSPIHPSAIHQRTNVVSFPAESSADSERLTKVMSVCSSAADPAPSTANFVKNLDKHSCDNIISPSQSSQGSSPKKRPARSSVLHRWSWAFICAFSIMSSLMIYSILQERIMTRPYIHGLPASPATLFRPPESNITRSNVFPLQKSNDPSAHSASLRRIRSAATATNPSDNLPAFFDHSLFLVLANRLFAAAVAALLILVRRRRDDLKSKAPLSDYAYISLSNVIATSCQYEALKWLTFPTVTIGKCAKMLPVMLILNLRSGRRYSSDDFGIVAVVLAGCAVMISSGNVVANRSASAQSDTPVGFILLITYLLFDAITSTYQERLFTKYDMSVLNQMLYMNLTSASLSIVGLALSGGLFKSLQFIVDYPAIVSDITTLSASAVAAQFAISLTIRMFGALLYAGIMTTRQFCSVLASDLIFKHGLTFMQWSGALMVFSALFYKLYRKATQNPTS